MSIQANEHIAEILRGQAWERTKGELQCMLVTFYSEPDKFEELSKTIKAFVAKVENVGLQE